MFKKNIVHALSICSLLFFATNAHSDQVTLYVPIMDDSPQQHLFFHDLLNSALKASGHELTLISKTLPQLRIKKYMDTGELSVFWALESEALNEQYIAVKVALTDGFIGKRILLIKEGNQYLYDNVKNLDDFRQLDLVAGMGRGWFDVDIWKKNQLKYKESAGNWKSIFKMIPYGRDYHYISRGMNEVLAEAKQYPSLEIEKRLVFIYDRDFYFYLSKTGPHSGNEFREIIENAMKHAEKSGLIKEIIEKHWPEALKRLNYDKRIKIHLEMP